MLSETDEKFVEIIQRVYVTLSGYADRCNGMVDYVRKEMKRGGARPSLKQIIDVATRYFQEVCSKRKYMKCDFTIFLCSWIPLKMYVF